MKSALLYMVRITGGQPIAHNLAALSPSLMMTALEQHYGVCVPHNEDWDKQMEYFEGAIKERGLVVQWTNTNVIVGFFDKPTI